MKYFMFIALLFVSLLANAKGILLPNVTTKDICVSGYSKGIRPSSTYTNKIKVQLMKDQKLTGSYILDHIQPIENGGDPKDPLNLQLQTPADSKRKDVLENSLHKEICTGKITIIDAAKKIDEWK